MYINLVGTYLILAITCLAGIIAYCVYYDCDLITSKRITKGEEILPRMVMDLLSDLPGLSGLFVAAVYSATLSTISSGLNSLATVCIKDFVQPFYVKHPMSDKKTTNLSKLLGSMKNNMF
jgi:sodium-coupled monocarboxylate transporter 8/12